MHEKANRGNKLNPDVFWIKEDTAYLLPSIKNISASVKSYVVDRIEKYYFEVDSVSCIYDNKEKAYKEYNELIKKLNAFHYRSIE